MRNIDKWRYFLKDIVSPDSYIDWGWYFAISAALQRRVWAGDIHLPIFPNLYVVLVGDAAVGKSLVVDRVESVLKHWNADFKHDDKKIEDDNIDVEEAAKGFKEMSDYEIQTFLKDKQVRSTGKRRALFPIASNAITYEALVRAIASNVQKYQFQIKSGGKFVEGAYMHCSTGFVLSELGSLFRKHTEDVVTFLQQTYDCGDYEYETKTQGKDEIKKCCVGILAGTTPSFMQRVFTDELLTEGIASRTIFVFETRNRFTKAIYKPMTQAQKEARSEVLDHLKQLATLYGHVKMEPGLEEYIEAWWKDEYNGVTRVNKATKLDHYYGRKNLHAVKLAMAMHFSESTDMLLTKADFDNALSLLARTEVNMHNALMLDNKNPINTVMKKIVSYIKRYGPQTMKDIVVEFYPICEGGMASLNEAIESALQIGKLRKEKIDSEYKLVITEVQESPEELES